MLCNEKLISSQISSLLDIDCGIKSSLLIAKLRQFTDIQQQEENKSLSNMKNPQTKPHEKLSKIFASGRRLVCRERKVAERKVKDIPAKHNNKQVWGEHKKCRRNQRQKFDTSGGSFRVPPSVSGRRSFFLAPFAAPPFSSTFFCLFIDSIFCGL